MYTFFKFFGKKGLYVYGALAVVVANMQVLRLGCLCLTDHPIALGTVVFTSTYFVSDILTELYSPQEAFKVVGISFLAVAFIPTFMLFTLLYPGPKQEAIDTAIQTLFSPSLRLLVASLISYAVSQCLDVFLFQKLKTYTKSKYLGLRSGLSLIASAFIDTTLFSLLAWVILAPQPLPWATVWYGYIASSLIIRLMATLCFSPCLYLFRKSDAQLSRF